MFRSVLAPALTSRAFWLLAVGTSLTLTHSAFGQAGMTSEWARVNLRGVLEYKTSKKGDHIMDFSFAGYMGGGVALPSVPGRKTVNPSGHDDTSAIQEAIDAVSRLAPSNGFRGAVELGKGTFHCQETLNIRTDGVVLRGSGSGGGGTTIEMTGKPHVCINVAGAEKSKEIGRPVPLTDAYLPSGTSVFHAGNPNEFKVGDTIRILRPVTRAWIDFMNMDDLVRNGKQQTWLTGSIETDRTIRAMNGDSITIDMPVSDSFDARLLNPPGATVVKFLSSGAISQNGIENLHIVSPGQSVTIDEAHHSAIHMNGVTDGWIRNLMIEDTVNSIHLGTESKRLTVENVEIRHSVPTKGAAKPADFTVSGMQILMNRCSGKGDNIFYFVTGAKVTGPNVLLHCTFHGNGHIQPHARWATGLLVDNCEVPESGIDFMNRGIMGSGHGWTVGWAVAWNCVANSFLVQQPPGSGNWVIGCKGKIEAESAPGSKGPDLPTGLVDSMGKFVTPESLYLEQLRERLGPQAVKAIGY